MSERPAEQAFFYLVARKAGKISSLRYRIDCVGDQLEPDMFHFRRKPPKNHFPMKLLCKIRNIGDSDTRSESLNSISGENGLAFNQFK